MKSWQMKSGIVLIALAVAMFLLVGKNQVPTAVAQEGELYGSATPTPICYKVTINRYHMSAGQKVYTGDLDKLENSCLYSTVNSLVNSCYSDKVANDISEAITTKDKSSGGKDQDSCFAHLLSNRIAGTRYDSGDIKDDELISKTVYLDSSCNKISTPTWGDNPCGDALSFRYAVTPLALQFSTSDVSPSAVNVSLEPNSSAWYIWKGSNEMPLLVYDAEERGIVNASEQLFGQFTFGKYWKDGFEALASLDADNNGKIENTELAKISLWFDRNQNGKSDEGEVRSAKDVGLISLSYNTDKIDTSTGDLYASVGYERLVNNQISKGAIVDWFSKSFATKEDAELAIAQLEKNEFFAFVSNAVAEPMPLQPDLSAKVTGVWFWSFDGKGSPKEVVNMNGAIAFMERKPGEIIGQSMIEIPIEAQGVSQKMVSVNPMGSVRKSTGPNGNTTVRFTTKSKDGLVTENTASIAPDGMAMHGSSKQEAWLDKEGGKKKMLYYTWKAVRFRPAKG